ncbi:MAG: hypothetical protein WAL99_03845 [Pseudonocardiaceae bacterium]
MKISTRYTEPAAPSGGPREALSCAERHLGAAPEPGCCPVVDGDPVDGVAGTLAVVGTAVVPGVPAGPAVVALEQAANASASTLSAAMRCPDVMTSLRMRQPTSSHERTP